ncbi:hypothetical protein BZA05DRAFT_42889 [Tricharina praecox]|uniref:uncharacterized protein n=1 Tax=Tricharina praecox TaxID=43433 RepID=UPI00221FA262|nr:uncharacterized protein BZA05DRAFT_42889 [Tricharina praecox]KAI5852377.1 hypothetical protein BZA05DRAFT_42889 [Tricharina praecox]
MVSSSTVLVALAAMFAVAVNAQNAAYQQCGGMNWAGSVACSTGYHCEKLNDWYSQCLPGAGSSTTAAVSSNTGTTTTRSTSSTTTSTAGGTIPTAGGTSPGSTLQKDYLWIRAVAAPNFHKYLQSRTARTATDAIIDSPTTAGQFNVVGGQLVQLVDTAGTLLYGHVAARVGTETQLKLTWEATPDTFGTFAFQGDTLTWSVASITRPNVAAWLVCENQTLYVNLGAYLYLTPDGCADQTIHYYNGATADA